MSELMTTVHKELLEGICSEVIGQLRPGVEEQSAVKALTEMIIAKLNARAKEMGIEAQAISVGSTARNTWVSGEADIDIFIMFPAETSEEDLKEQGLALARRVCESERYEERYASHPYIHARFHYAGREFDVDLVPCFAVEEASRLKSAVDRTPFHNEYIIQRLTGSGLEDEVRLLKRFLRCLGIYGSEQRRRGFSGYLCELLILKYRSFISLLEHAAKWRYGERIEVEIETEGGHEEGGRSKYRGDDPLIVIDPVDPKRNVAAAVSLYSFCRLIDGAREFLARPSREFFIQREANPLSESEFQRIAKERGTVFVLLRFKAPDVVEDILYPQLRKAEASIRRLIERNDFVVYRSGVTMEGDKAVIVFELLVWQLPAIKKHIGPPVTAVRHAEKFKRRHPPPYLIEDGRYVVEVKRRYTDVLSLLRNELQAASLGKDVSKAIEEGYEVLRIEDIPFSTDIGLFFRDYFGLCSPVIRVEPEA